MEIDLESPLARVVAEELDCDPPAAARALADAILSERPAVAAILFYGSCLRKQTSDGVFDFYVLVDRYSQTYDSRLLALANALLPPNVFYIETDLKGERLRAKYAVLSCEDFEAAVNPDCIHPYIWARFSQPALLVHARDDTARAVAIRAAAKAVVTLVMRLGVFLPSSRGIQRFSLSALWQEAFHRTYGAERRAEAQDTIQGIYLSAAPRYDAAATAAIEYLEAMGWYKSVSPRGDRSFEVMLPEWRRLLGILRWQCTRPIARALALMRLLKTAFTFGDWVPYAIWKMERHTGEKIEISDRQRRHPLIFGWPVIWRVYLRR